MADSPEAVLLDEARRAIARQETTLDTLHVKAVAVLSSAAVVAGLLGASLPGGHFGGFAVAAVIVFAVTGVLAVIILRPVDMEFSGKLGPLFTHLDDLPDLTDEARAVATRQYERDVASALDRYRIDNKDTIEDKTKLFACTCALLGVQVVLWAIARLKV